MWTCIKFVGLIFLLSPIFVLAGLARYMFRSETELDDSDLVFEDEEDTWEWERNRG